LGARPSVPAALFVSFFSLVSNAESAMQGCAARWPDIGPEVSPELVVSELGLLGF
jgi:hypothetical protein